jgi:hypothetical protein
METLFLFVDKELGLQQKQNVKRQTRASVEQWLK